LQFTDIAHKNHSLGDASFIIAQAKAVLGEHLVSKASNGAKKLEVKAEGDDLYTVFPNGFSKSLRYGATLELTDV